MTCYQTDTPLTYNAGGPYSAEVGFDRNSTITLRFTLKHPTTGLDMDVLSCSCTSSGPTCTVDYAVSPNVGVAEFHDSDALAAYPITLGHDDPEVLNHEIRSPTTVVTITTKTEC